MTSCCVCFRTVTSAMSLSLRLTACCRRTRRTRVTAPTASRNPSRRAHSSHSTRRDSSVTTHTRDRDSDDDDDVMRRSYCRWQSAAGRREASRGAWRGRKEGGVATVPHSLPTMSSLLYRNTTGNGRKSRCMEHYDGRVRNGLKYWRACVMQRQIRWRHAWDLVKPPQRRSGDTSIWGFLVCTRKIRRLVTTSTIKALRCCLSSLGVHHQPVGIACCKMLPVLTGSISWLSLILGSLSKLSIGVALLSLWLPI